MPFCDSNVSANSETHVEVSQLHKKSFLGILNCENICIIIRAGADTHQHYTNISHSYYYKSKIWRWNLETYTNYYLWYHHTTDNHS